MLQLSAVIRVPVPSTVFLVWFVERSPVGLFDAWGPIPGVAAVENQTGAWTEPGSRRTLALSDGARITETVLAYELPVLFCYQMSGFGGFLGRLVEAIDGEWRIRSLIGESEVAWTYRFHDRDFAARVLLAPQLPLWRGYMRAAIEAVAAAARAEVGKVENESSPRRRSYAKRS